MAELFAPNLDILPPAQRRLWGELAAIPGEFVLYGGTAIVLHLDHRSSADFDFFARKSFDPDRLYCDIPFLAGAEVIQKADVRTRLMRAVRVVDPEAAP